MIEASEKFDTIEYLKFGTDRQRQAYAVLMEYEILSKLNQYCPLLVGTIPINIDIESSDLDIICSFTDKNTFIDMLKSLFGNLSDFNIRENLSNHSVIAHFSLCSFEIEVFGQNIPTKEQHAYRHMIIEDYLLTQKGEDFRKQIIELKKQGYKTEPAFAHILGLKGDPYLELLNLT